MGSWEFAETALEQASSPQTMMGALKVLRKTGEVMGRGSGRWRASATEMGELKVG
jgi:hypothetical protein